MQNYKFIYQKNHLLRVKNSYLHYHLLYLHYLVV